MGKLFVEAEQFVVSEFFNVEVVEEFFNVKVVDEFFDIEVVDEFFNVEVVEELFCVEVVEEVFVFAAIRLLLRGCRAPFTFFKASRLKTSLCTYLNETFPLSSCS